MSVFSSEKQKRYCLSHSIIVKIKHEHGGEMLSTVIGPD